MKPRRKQSSLQIIQSVNSFNVIRTKSHLPLTARNAGVRYSVAIGRVIVHRNRFQVDEIFRGGVYPPLLIGVEKWNNPVVGANACASVPPVPSKGDLSPWLPRKNPNLISAESTSWISLKVKWDIACHLEKALAQTRRWGFSCRWLEQIIEGIVIIDTFWMVRKVSELLKVMLKQM